MNVTFDTRRFDKRMKHFLNVADKAVPIIERESISHFKRAFTDGGFTDRFFIPWKPNNASNRTLLKSGALRRSIRTMIKTKRTITIGSRLKYSKIHNEGGTIRVTGNMKSFFWLKYKETGLSKWKAMALSEKIEIPKRQFMGDSVVLRNKIIRSFVNKHIKNK